MSGTTTARRLAGIASILIDGTAFNVVGDLVWSPSKLKRETLVGQDGVHGYSEMPLQGHIACTLRDAGSISVLAFNSMTNSTVQVVQANGKTIVGTGMWCVDPQEVKTQEGSFEVRFEGDNVQEIVAT